MNFEPHNSEGNSRSEYYPWSSAEITSYFASLLDSGKPRVKDYSMMDPSEVAKMILIPASLLFETPLTFRTHLSS